MRRCALTRPGIGSVAVKEVGNATINIHPKGRRRSAGGISAVKKARPAASVIPGKIQSRSVKTTPKLTAVLFPAPTERPATINAGEII
jgi:hypothetical protein